LLKELLAENVPLPEALTIVQQAMEMIQELETFLPASSNISFRERLVIHMERGNADLEFQLKADALLVFFDKHFGVNDFFDKPVEE